jgi:GWxTD domain-containing protein
VSCGVALAAWQSPAQNGPEIVPAIPVVPAPSLQAVEKAQAAPAVHPAADLMQKLEVKKAGSSSFMMALAQDTLANPAPWPYQKWLDEEASYIITAEERNAFKSLTTNEEREMFIKQFWARRDPATPQDAALPEYPAIQRGNPENAFKKEHYRRIAYVNDLYGTKMTPGWKTDRGRIYIQYGPPDEIDSHPSGGPYDRPQEEGGGQTTTYPFEQWRYRSIKGIGTNIILEFVDATRTGEYRMTMDPHAKDASLYVPGAGLTLFRLIGGPQGMVDITPERKMVVTVPIAFDAAQYLITISTVSSDGKTNLGNSQVLANSCKTAAAKSECLVDSWRSVGATALPPGTYTFTAVVKDTASSTQKTYVVNFTVN